MLHELLYGFIDLIGSFGYLGVFFLMFLESSLIPVPSEVVMIPAGFLAQQGDMNLLLVILTGTVGNVLGAIFNYAFAKKVGRAFLLKYGQYFFISDHAVHKMESFFSEHGPISTFTARLIPGLRHYISLQAGISNMDLKQFTVYTTAGAGIWVIILSILGYIFGENEELINQYLHQITIVTLVAIIAVVGIYILKKRKKREKEPAGLVKDLIEG